MGKARNYEIGYGRPPKETRWKKGQCGNPGRIGRNRPMDVAKLIEQSFARKINIVEGDQPRRATVFEAIVLQLWMGAMAGNSRALHVLIKYHEFARSQGGLGGIEVRVIKDPS